jgi:hypothetical protein
MMLSARQDRYASAGTPLGGPRCPTKNESADRGFLGVPAFCWHYTRSVWVVRRHEADLTMEAERALPLGPVKSRRHEASSWVPANTHNAH